MTRLLTLLIFTGLITACDDGDPVTSTDTTAPIDTRLDATPPRDTAPPDLGCADGALRCGPGGDVEVCSGGTFSLAETCDNGCSNASCLTESPPSGTCATPLPLSIGETVTGTTHTFYTSNDWSSTCANAYGFNANGPETVYTLSVPTTAPLRITATPKNGAEYLGLYLRSASACEDTSTQYGQICDGNLLGQDASIEGVFAAGDYALIVDSFAGYEGGDFELSVTPAASPTCYGTAPTLIDIAEGPVTLTDQIPTRGNDSYWRLSECPADVPVSRTDGAERIFLLVLAQETRVRMTLTDLEPTRPECAIGECLMTLYLRNACEEIATQTACAFSDTETLVLTEPLPPGPHYLIVDDFNSSIDTAQPFEITVEALP